MLSRTSKIILLLLLLLTGSGQAQFGYGWFSGGDAATVRDTLTWSIWRSTTTDAIASNFAPYEVDSISFTRYGGGTDTRNLLMRYVNDSTWMQNEFSGISYGGQVSTYWGHVQGIGDTVFFSSQVYPAGGHAFMGAYLNGVVDTISTWGTGQTPISDFFRYGGINWYLQTNVYGPSLNVPGSVYKIDMAGTKTKMKDFPTADGTRGYKPFAGTLVGDKIFIVAGTQIPSSVTYGAGTDTSGSSALFVYNITSNTLTKLDTIGYYTPHVNGIDYFIDGTDTLIYINAYGTRTTAINGLYKYSSSTGTVDFMGMPAYYDTVAHSKYCNVGLVTNKSTGEVFIGIKAQVMNTIAGAEKSKVFSYLNGTWSDIGFPGYRASYYYSPTNISLIGNKLYVRSTESPYTYWKSSAGGTTNAVLVTHIE